jgi:L-asparaginase II
MRYTALIETTRGVTPECLHLGSIAVVNTQGQVLAQAGDAHMQSFTRSTLKALQALPLMTSGAADAFGFDARDLAMTCASHNGEDMHVQQVQSMLDKTGIGHQRLACGCHLPLRFVYTAALPPADLQYDERHNNCSGKHSGFLAACAHLGLPLEGYTEPAHPLQQQVRLAVAQACQMDEHAMPMGLDGCSAPNYAMPLSKLALGYARLASGARDAQFGEAFARLSEAMTAHPDLVSGTERNDLDFMRIGAGDWVTKVGADGVQVVASKSRGEALAIKVLDGNKQALFATTVAALDQLGWLSSVQREALAPWAAQEIVNARGLVVGHRRAVFALGR